MKYGQIDVYNATSAASDRFPVSGAAAVRTRKDSSEISAPLIERNICAMQHYDQHNNLNDGLSSKLRRVIMIQRP